MKKRTIGQELKDALKEANAFHDGKAELTTSVQIRDPATLNKVRNPNKNPWRIAPSNPTVLVEKNPYRLSLFIDFLPDIQLNNSHGHWTTRYQKIRKAKATVGFQVFEFKPDAPLKTARLTLVRHSTREPDFDNLVASFKPVIDALAEYQIIEADKPSNIGQPSYNWVKSKKVGQGISILVEEVRDGSGGGVKSD